MANLTLTDARINVAQLVDDPNSRRWTTAQVDACLAQSLSACVSQYVSHGGTAFDAEIVVVSSAAGVVALSTVAPVLDIRSVSIQFGTGTNLTYAPCPASLRVDRYAIENAVYSCAITYVQDYRLSTTGSDPLVGIGAVEAPSWPDFERWICADAAACLAIKDNDQRAGLQALEQKARDNVLTRVVTPKAFPLTLPRSVGMQQRRLSYVLTASPATPTLQLVRARGQDGFSGGW